MTVPEAYQIARSFYRKDCPSDEDVFMFTEAMQFIISETKSPDAMLDLGGYYYGQKEYGLALKYYELAAEYKSTAAYECLGYVWYYGRTGRRDFEKAFKYFSLGKEAGNIVSSYKIADMYKNGYYVEKSFEKYKEIIEELYDSVKNADDLGEPLPEIFTRLARIRKDEGKTDEAVRLYLYAKDFLAQRISYNAFFGNLNIMMWLIDDLYTLTEFDEENFDFYDLYYLLQRPCRAAFRRGREHFELEVSDNNGGELEIRLNDKWFRTREDFFKKASSGDSLLTAIYDELYGFEVTEWK